MNQEFFLKAATRREMLRASSFLAGGSALAGLMPRTLLAGAQAAPAGKAQKPGHGPAGDKAALTKYRDMLVTVRDKIKAQKDSGKTLKEVVAAKPTADLDAAWGAGIIMPDAFVTFVYTTL